VRLSAWTFCALTALFRILGRVTALLAMSDALTALLFMSPESTVFLPGRATAVPDRAARSATKATAMAGDGRRPERRCICYLQK
jgi:hypothetical protein